MVRHKSVLIEVLALRQVPRFLDQLLGGGRSIKRALIALSRVNTLESAYFIQFSLLSASKRLDSLGRTCRVQHFEVVAVNNLPRFLVNGRGCRHCECGGLRRFRRFIDLSLGISGRLRLLLLD